MEAYPGGRHVASARRLRGEAEVREREGREKAPGHRFRDCAGCPELVVVGTGSYMMGSPRGEEGRDDDEGPVHRVTIGEPIAVGVYEVTLGEFGRFVGEMGHSQGDGCWTYEGGKWEERSGRSWRNPGYSQTDGHPVACVIGNDAQAYIRWLSRETGEGYRLLSESEWEYVARGGAGTSWYWGDGTSEQCAHANGADRSVKRRYPDWKWDTASCDDGHVHTAPAGSFAPNGYGLHDVLGNVWEWVEDCWHDNYDGAPTDGSARTSGGDCSRRVLRGGSWYYNPRFVRSADRNSGTPPGTGQLCRFPSCQDVELSPESLVPCLLRGSRGRQPPGDFFLVLESVCTISNSRLNSVRIVTTNICSSSRIRRLCRCRIVRPHVPRRASCTEAVLHRRVA